VEGLAAVLLSLKRRPIIRHQRNSDISQRVAEDIARLAYEQEPGLFDFRRDDGTSQLIILDRMDDPVTPLLSQWTYQAMVHELLGIDNNRVNVLDASKQKQPMVISSSADVFFQQNMYANYGDLGLAVKKLVDDFQAVSKMNKHIDSIEDMQRFVESFPEFRHQSGNVSKHVALMSELSRIISENSLMAVSQVEQEVSCGSDKLFAYNSVMDQLADAQVKPIECLKLVLLFTLRYEKDGTRLVDNMVAALSRRNIEPSHLRLVKDIVEIAGEDCRTGDLFGNRNFFARASKIVGGLKGADNVYTQHQPLLVQTLENIFKGKAKDSDYPYVRSTGNSDTRPQDLLVFIIGGITYEEARFIAQMNESGQGVHVTLGGTTILNSRMFLQDLTKATEGTDVEGRRLGIHAL
jgi:vacuolar protein sorting-associated protein 45